MCGQKTHFSKSRKTVADSLFSPLSARSTKNHCWPDAEPWSGTVCYFPDMNMWCLMNKLVNKFVYFIHGQSVILCEDACSRSAVRQTWKIAELNLLVSFFGVCSSNAEREMRRPCKHRMRAKFSARIFIVLCAGMKVDSLWWEGMIM